MRLFVAALVVTATLYAGPAQAADLFAMSFEDFRKAFDKRIREDTLDKAEVNFSTTKQCTKKGTTSTCTFNDKGFQSTVASFKKMDLVSGKFTLKLTLTAETKDGKVSHIRLIGSRGDPVNIFQYVSTVMNIMQLFEPGIVDGEGKSLALVKQLGIMRGDADPSINEPVVNIEPYAVVECLNVHSNITSGVACNWTPRS